MRGLLVATTVVAAIIVGVLAVAPAHAQGPDPTNRQALAELVFAGAPLTSQSVDASPSIALAAPLSSTGSPAALDLIQKLAELHEAGILTDAEFAAKKAELLSRL